MNRVEFEEKWKSRKEMSTILLVLFNYGGIYATDMRITRSGFAEDILKDGVEFDIVDLLRTCADTGVINTGRIRLDSIVDVI